MRALLAIAIGSICISVPATAGEPAEDKRICKRVLDTHTGSNLRGSKRVCRPASEWKELEDEKDRLMRRVGDGAGPSPNYKGPAGGPG